MPFKAKFIIECEGEDLGCRERLETYWTNLPGSVTGYQHDFELAVRKLPNEGYPKGWRTVWNTTYQRYEWLCPKHAPVTFERSSIGDIYLYELRDHKAVAEASLVRSRQSNTYELHIRDYWDDEQMRTPDQTRMHDLHTFVADKVRAYLAAAAEWRAHDDSGFLWDRVGE